MGEDSIESDVDSEKTPLKDYWDGLQKNISVAGRKVAASSKKAAKAASDWGGSVSDKIKEEKERLKDERDKRQSEYAEQLKSDEKFKEILPVGEKVPLSVTITVDEYESINQQIIDLQAECERHANLVEEMQALTEELVEREEKDPETKLVVVKEVEAPLVMTEEERKGFVSEMKQSMDQILLSLGGSVVWAALLVGLDMYLDSEGYTYQGYSLGVVVWPLGTALWSLFLLSRLAKARTVLSMSLSMRLKTAIGIGLATELAMILMNEEMQAITNVWGWTATTALAAFLLSGFFRGIAASISRILGFKKRRNKPELVDITEQ
ncbi:MAG: hypothetical protein CMB37_04680 [Euryarchaeota archaeon]|nr:hypothetical protein [Euryarchaeota archaeon]